MAELETGLPQELREQQRAMGAVLRAVASGQGLQPVLDEVAASSMRICRANTSSLYVLDGGLLHAVARAGGDFSTWEYDQTHPHELDRTTVVGRAVLARGPAHIPDVLDDAEYTYGGPRVGYRSLLGVPILFEDELIGGMTLTREVPTPFTDEQIELVQTFADQAAIAIKNARLLETVERQLSQQRAVRGVMRSVARSQGLQGVLDDIVESAASLTGVENGRLFLLEGGLLHAVANYGSEENFEHERQHPHAIDRSSMTGRAALTGQPVHIPDVLEDPEYTYAERVDFSYRSGVTVPIFLEEELIGALGIVSDQPGAFAEEHVELLQTFADQAAIAIANARLIDAVEQQLHQQRAISDVLGVVARAEGLDAVFDAVVETAARLCTAEYGQLCVADGDVLRLAGTYGTSREVDEYERTHPAPRDRTSVVGRVAVTGDVVHIPDTLEDPEYTWAGQPAGGYRAMLGVPIYVDDELTGVINVVRNEPLPFTEEQIELVKTFADQAAIAIANARLIDAVERQRTELSRFVSPQVAELISSEDGEKMLAGHRAYVSVLFCDLRGFTAFSETAAPEELFEVLGEYHRAMGELVPRYHGTLEHFAGDGLMVFFNDPLPVEQHELEAVRFAVSAQECFAELAAGWRKRGIELGLGIGIASGYATLGRIGFEGRYDYGALGPVSNLASRLSSAAEPGQTLIAQRVHAAVEDEVEAEELGELDLKGFGRPVVAYALQSVVQSAM